MADKGVAADDVVSVVEETDPADAADRIEEMEEERNSADGKPRKLNIRIEGFPTIRRNQHGDVTSASVVGTAKFKGRVLLHLSGDIASAYWSVTPGMDIVALAIERSDGEYDIEHMDILRPVDK